MRAYMVSPPQHGTCRGISARAQPNQLSRDFLHANRFALRNALAVPVRAKARCGYRARKSNVGEEQKAEQRHDEQRAQDVPSLQVPRPKLHDVTITPVHAGSGTDFCAAVNPLPKRVKMPFSTSFLDFRPFRAFNPRTFSERRSFRPAARPMRPEANARQRDAPSGAKVFGRPSS